MSSKKIDMDKEKWIEEVLLSVDQQKLVNPDKDLFDTILLRIEEEKQQSIPLYLKLGIAASFLVLVSLNISFLNNGLKENQPIEQDVLLLQFDNNSTNQLYTE